MSRPLNIGPRLLENLISKIHVTKKCWIWKGKNTEVHPSDKRAYIKVNGKWKIATREFYKQAIGPIPKGIFVCHTCDNGLCLKPTHLWLGTHSENMRDKILKGRGNNPKGNSHWRTHLGKCDILKMRLLYFSKEKTSSQLSSIYHLSRSQIWKICTNKQWSHI